METMVLPIEALHLPEKFASMFKSKKVKITAQKDTLTIKAISSSDADAALERICGMFKSDGHELDRYFERKRQDKELELELDERRYQNSMKAMKANKK